MTTNLEKQAITFFDKHRDCGSFTTSDQANQIRKLSEEVGEFIEAVINKDKANAVMEAGDVAWLLVDILNVLGADQLSTGQFIALEKLHRRHTS